MPLFKCSIVFDFTTDPTDRATATAHSGGASESYWINDTAENAQAAIRFIAPLRANFLPRETQVIGWRMQSYTISQNRLYAGGASSGSLNLPGSNLWTLSAPQNALMLKMTAADGLNTSVHLLRNLPKEQITNGEYQPENFFFNRVQLFRNGLTGRGFGGVGVDKTVPFNRVVAVTNSTVTLFAPPAGFVVGDFVQVRRLYVAGRFQSIPAALVTNITGNNVTIEQDTFMGGPFIVNGSMTKITRIFFPYADGEQSRLVVRKIGRGFSPYHGRQSKRKAR